MLYLAVPVYLMANSCACFQLWQQKRCDYLFITWMRRSFRSTRRLCCKGAGSTEKRNDIQL